jgi:hypothetical protein
VTRPAPAWLGEFQERFGSVLRTPLDRAPGTLTARVDRYDPGAVDEVADAANVTAAERLAVYNRQLWCRLFDVLQSAYPLACSLVGAWSFNAYAAGFLEASPPRGFDLDAVPDGFAAFFAASLEREDHADRAALAEAAQIDAAFRAVFRAPRVAPFHPTNDDAPRLFGARLVASPAVVVVTEHRALLTLRRALLGGAADLDAAGRAAMPSPLPCARAIALVRADRGTAEVELEPREAELLSLLSQHAVGDALGRLERACAAAERAALPEQARRWLAASVQRGFWSGLEDVT